MLRKKILLFLFTFITFTTCAQDIIYKIDGCEIYAKIIEIEQSNIRYKNFEQHEGPIRNISKSQVFMIKYHDGSTEKFTSLANLNIKPLDDTTKKVITTTRLDYDFQKKQAKSMKRIGTDLIITGAIGMFSGGVFVILSESKATGNSSTIKSIGILLFGVSVPLAASGVTVTCIGNSKLKKLSKIKTEFGIQIVPFDKLTNSKIESVHGLSIALRFVF